MGQIGTTKHFWQIDKSDKRISVFQGGSRSGKTYNIMLWLIKYAIKTPNQIISVVRSTMPSLEATAFRDFEDIMRRMGIYDQSRLKKKPLEYRFNQGTLMEFFSVDMEEKIRGRARNVLFVNEANELKFKDYTQLVIRTDTKIILDYNPSINFWVYDKVLNRNDVDFYKSTWRDNAFIPRALIDEIEQLKNIDDALYKVYGLGELANIQGIIFEFDKHWVQCDELPTEYKKRIICGDFGFSNDPTAIIDLRLAHGELWAKEITYKTGLLNNDIADILRPLANRCVFDSAEPKSIAEIVKAGIDIHPSQKGRDSINNGINLIKQYKLNVTSDSINLIKELRNYRWQENKQGEQLSKPIDAFNHNCDAIRYGCFDMFNQKNVFFI